MKTQQEDAGCEAGGSLTRNHPCQHLDVEIPMLQNYDKYIFVAYKLLNLWHFVIEAQMD